MPQDDIAQAWKSFSPERRDALLAKMSPEQKKKLRATLEGGTATAASPEQNTPGYFKRLGQGVGAPTNMKELEAAQPSTTEKILGPAAIAGKLIYRYGKNVYEQGKESAKEAFEAGENIGKGGPVGANLGKAAAGYSDFILKGLAAPVGGAALSAWGEDIGKGNVAGAAGDATAVLLDALFLKGAMKPSKGVQTSKIAFAADIPESMANPKAQLQAVLPEIEAASPKAPSTVGEMLESVNKAKQNINSQVGQAILPLRGKQMVPTTISDAIKSHITPDMQMTPQGRQMMTALRKAAVQYDKPWSYEQLHAARINANARLRTFFGKGSGAQYGDMKTQVDTIVDREVARGVQDIVYPEMDKAAGKPPGFFANLLNKQSTLITLGQALDENAKALAVRTAKIKGSPRFSSENVSAYGHPTSTPGISIHKLQNVVVRPNPLGQANAAVARATGSFAGSPVSHSMIYTLPVRELLIQHEDEKTPGELRDKARQLAPK